ncbi:hypothetical protein GX50_08975 [[Emmonsia] crescens]|uniref:Uncharacterized protein n=1 Tax=[Emmonsia] crescens TaxID=73230 RepID=A0A2B7Z1A5_9EURO|nr:hypothetical protein GX50_08975 [Emmonsia crescens]
MNLNEKLKIFLMKGSALCYLKQQLLTDGKCVLMTLLLNPHLQKEGANVVDYA